MKTYTTNYKDTFIAVAEDCKASAGEVPPLKNDKKTIANIHFGMISKHPYKYTSDDVVFQAYAEKNDLTKNELAQAREQFFSKGQPCLRASPLTKRYGWGIHNDSEGKVALFGCESIKYEKLSTDKKINVVKAMRSGK